jgi:hypothetical protein
MIHVRYLLSYLSFSLSLSSFLIVYVYDLLLIKNSIDYSMHHNSFILDIYEPAILLSFSSIFLLLPYIIIQIIADITQNYKKINNDINIVIIILIKESYFIVMKLEIIFHFLSHLNLVILYLNTYN